VYTGSQRSTLLHRLDAGLDGRHWGFVARSRSRFSTLAHLHLCSDHTHAQHTHHNHIIPYHTITSLFWRPDSESVSASVAEFMEMKPRVFLSQIAKIAISLKRIICVADYVLARCISHWVLRFSASLRFPGESESE